MEKQKHKEYTKPSEGLCWWDGCQNEGKFPAPKTPHNPTERYFFCLEHIRDYNKSWDFFRNMDMSQINNFEKDSIGGHRPTWKFGVGLNHHNMEEIRRRVFGLYRGTYSKQYKTNEESAAMQNLPKGAKEALKVLGLNYPLTMAELKKKYKALAKAHHPDLNGKTDDRKIKSINHAYTVLKGMDIF